MATMRAVLVDRPGGPDHLRLGEAPRPVPGPEELLVRVHATALNRADLMQREGRYPPPEGASPVLGLEAAGVVEAVGSACVGWAIGDRVFGLLPGGGYAAYVAIRHDHAMRIPDALSFEEAAAVPEVFLTAFQALHWLGAVQQGEVVLIHAGASGVGTAAIQLARLAGAFVYVTASAAKHPLCLELGAAGAIDYQHEAFPERLRELGGGGGADVIIDFVGAPYLHDNVDALALDGRLVVLATMGGSRVDSFDLRGLFRKRATLVTSTLRSRSDGYKAHLTRAFADAVLPQFEDGTLRPVIDSIYAWTDVAEAHRRMEANENAGKIVLRVT